jgi:hypothetical protein
MMLLRTRSGLARNPNLPFLDAHELRGEKYLLSAVTFLVGMVIVANIFYPGKELIQIVIATLSLAICRIFWSLSGISVT